MNETETTQCETQQEPEDFDFTDGQWTGWEVLVICLIVLFIFGGSSS